MNTEEIRAYFLSSQEELTQNDYQLTAEKWMFELAEQVESELIDDYVIGILTAEEMEAFERNYLSTDARRVKVAYARRLSEASNVGGEPGVAKPSAGLLPRFWRPLAIGTSIAAVSVVAAFLGFEVSRQRVSENAVPEVPLQGQPAQVAVNPRLEEVGPDSTSEKDSNSDKKTTQKFTPATIVLSPGLMRSGGKEIVLSQEETRVPFLMKLLTEPGARTFPTYSVKIETPEGRQISTSSTIVRVTQFNVTVSVKGSFDEGTYIVYLSGVTNDGREDSVGEYVFRVSERKAADDSERSR